MKETFKNLKDKLILKHAEVKSGKILCDSGAETVEYVVMALGGLMIGTFIVFQFLGITADDIVPGIKSTFQSMFDNITTS